MIGDFIMALTNLAHIFNKEIKGTVGCIEEHNIAMHVLHSLPACMQSIQTLILETAPESDKGNWDLSKLKQAITNDKQRAQATGEQLGTKLDLASTPNALTVQGQHHQMKKKDTSNPRWLAKQTCWRCRKLGHIHQGCTASQAEREAYHASKMVEQSMANIIVNKPDKYVKAMIAEDVTSKLDMCMMARIIECAEVTIAETTLEHHACAAREDVSDLKPWVINSGCSAHFSLNQSEFITYMPYTLAHQIQLGDSRVVPSMGEGTVSLECLVHGKPLTHCLIHSIQYIPTLTYALLSCKALTHCGLTIIFKGNCCKIYHADTTLIAESSQVPNQLYSLNVIKVNPSTMTDNNAALTITPSFGLVFMGK